MDFFLRNNSLFWFKFFLFLFFIVIINKCTALYFHQMNEKQISLKTKHWRQKSHKIYQVFHILEQCNVVSSFEFFFTKNRLDSRAYVVLIRRVRNVQLSNHRIFWTKILLLSSGLIYIFFSTKSRWPIHSFIRSLDENNTHVIIPLKFIRWFSARKILCFMRNLHMYFFFLAKCACDWLFLNYFTNFNVSLLSGVHQILLLERFQAVRACNRYNWHHLQSKRIELSSQNRWTLPTLRQIFKNP